MTWTSFGLGLLAVLALAVFLKVDWMLMTHTSSGGVRMWGNLKGERARQYQREFIESVNGEGGGDEEEDDEDDD